MKYLKGCLGVFLAVIVIAAIFSGSSDTTNNSSPSNDNSVETEESSSEGFTEREKISLTGTGDFVSENIIIDNDYAIVRASHEGESNFVINAIPNGNGFDSLLVNNIGNYKGDTLLDNSESAESYIFEVSASGNWTIDIIQPGAIDATDNTSFSGSGDSVYIVNFKDGNNRIEATHSGDSNFVVQVSDPSNSFDFDSLVINEIGNYSGTNLYDKDGSGVVFLSIKADGAWTVNLK